MGFVFLVLAILLFLGAALFHAGTVLTVETVPLGLAFLAASFLFGPVSFPNFQRRVA